MPYNSIVNRGDDPTWDSTPGGHALISHQLLRPIIKGAIEKSAVLRFMKKRRIPGGVTQMPVLETKPLAYHVETDTGLKQTTTMTWDKVYFHVSEIAVIVPIPDNILDDVDYDLWDEFRPEIEEAFGRRIDTSILFGTGAPAIWPTAIVPAAIAAGNTVTQGTSVDVAADMSNTIGAVEADGFDPDGIVHRQDLRGTFRNLRDTTNGLLFKASMGVANMTYGANGSSRDGEIWGLPSRSLLNGTFEAYNTATANAAMAIVGDWSQAIFAIRSDISMKIFDQGVIQDGNGDIQYNLIQQDMKAARFVMRCAWAVPNPVNLTNETRSTRYPFSVMRDAA
jgi:HK97 family phage major capsid protein